MIHRGSWLRCLVLSGTFMLFGLMAGCGSDSDTSGIDVNTESLRIYQLWADSGSFAADAGDPSARRFQLTLSGGFDEEGEVMYFDNRGGKDAGFVTIGKLIRDVWPRVYGDLAPNATLKATTNEGVVYLSCIVEKPVLDAKTGTLTFAITYLSGDRPQADLAFTNPVLIITNNAKKVRPEIWSHQIDGDVATFEPVRNADGTFVDGTYTLRFQKALGNANGITCAPQRKSQSVPVAEYLQSWQARFGKVPPNATVMFPATNDQVGGVHAVTLSNPAFDEESGSFSFTAKVIYSPFLPIGKSGLSVKMPTLFIDGGPDGFPALFGNVFAIQFRNSTKANVTVWLERTQPPCSRQVAHDQGCSDTDWTKLQSQFAQSGTKFHIINAEGTYARAPVLSHTDLAPGETLRISPPLDSDRMPQWYYGAKGHEATAGVAAWVTKKGIQMPTIGAVTKLEFNLDNPHKQIVYDLSVIEGANMKVTMTYEGPGTSAPIMKECRIPLDAYDPVKNIDGCPYGGPEPMANSSAQSCINPKWYPYDSIGTEVVKPSWVVAAKDFTLTDADNSKYSALLAESTLALKGWIAYNQGINPNWNLPLHYSKDGFTGYMLAEAGIGDADGKKTFLPAKKAYHVWWATNPVSKGWKGYVQNNRKGICDSYVWAYDEKVWKPSDFELGNDGFTTDGNVNPLHDNPINPLISQKQYKDSYLNIDITQIK